MFAIKGAWENVSCLTYLFARSYAWGSFFDNGLNFTLEYCLASGGVAQDGLDASTSGATLIGILGYVLASIKSVAYSFFQSRLYVATFGFVFFGVG